MPNPDRIQRGEFYEDCRYHPMLCVQPSAPDDDELVGISLIDGCIGACSEDHCGVERMTVEEAIERKVNWNRFTEERGLQSPYPPRPGEVPD